jgi:hypothetical protein
MATRMMKLFDPGEMEEYIKRGAKRRKTGQEYALELQRAVDAAQMTRTEREQVGETRRLGITETGLGRRLGRTQEFARPLQEAQTGYYGAGAEASRATAGLTRETSDYARTVRPYKQEQERLKEKRAGLLTDIYERELEEPTGAFTNEYIMSLLSGKAKKPLGKRVYEDYLQIGY